VRDFQDWIREVLPVANRAEAPATGTVAALNDAMKRGHRLRSNRRSGPSPFSPALDVPRGA